MPDEPPPDVFISYSRHDRSACERLARAIEAAGMRCWYDTQIKPGTSFDRAIERAIGHAGAVLVLWSPRSADSEWVRNEARHGKMAGKLVAARIEACDLPLEFSGVQTIDLFGVSHDEYDARWKLLILRLRELKAFLAAPSHEDRSRDEPLVHENLVEQPSDSGDGHGALVDTTWDTRSGRPGLSFRIAFSLLLAITAVVSFVLWPNKVPTPPEPIVTIPDNASSGGSSKEGALKNVIAIGEKGAAGTRTTNPVEMDKNPASPNPDRFVDYPCKNIVQQVVVEKPIQILKFREERVVEPVATPVRLNAGYHADSYLYLDTVTERIARRNAECESQVWQTAWPGSGWSKKCDGGKMQDERADCRCTSTHCEVSLFGTCVRQTERVQSAPYTATEMRRVTEPQTVEICQ